MIRRFKKVQKIYLGWIPSLRGGENNLLVGTAGDWRVESFLAAGPLTKSNIQL
jgi:hypothetical protein